MDVLEAIRSRRSVRSFLDKPLPDELLWQIIEAGTWAPSAGSMGGNLRDESLQGRPPEPSKLMVIGSQPP